MLGFIRTYICVCVYVYIYPYNYLYEIEMIVRNTLLQIIEFYVIILTHFINNYLINLSIENEVWQRKKRTGSAITQAK